MAFYVYVDDAACIATLEELAVTAPEACAIGVNAALEEGAEISRSEVPVDTGAAKSKIDIVPATPTTIFDAQLRSMAQYSSVIENVEGEQFARARGSIPPPAKALLGWASRHNPYWNQGTNSDVRFAYIVSRSIGRKGILSQRFIAYLAEEKLPALIFAQLEIALAAWSAL